MLRIQRKRSKGWRKPLGAINCTRPGPWGNPFRVGVPYRNAVMIAQMFPAYEMELAASPVVELVPKDLDECLQFYRMYLRAKRQLYGEVAWNKLLDMLRGHDLMCFCPVDHKCHVDIILELLYGKDHQPNPGNQ